MPAPAPAGVPAVARGSKRKKQEAGPRVRAAEEMPPPSEPTEYARNRPRREAAGQRSKWGETGESLELVQCQEFMGPPGSGASLAQPFEVTVDSEVCCSHSLASSRQHGARGRSLLRRDSAKPMVEQVTASLLCCRPCW